MELDGIIADTLENISAPLITSPGEGYGSCHDAFTHRDCAWQRATIAQPIVYYRHFYEFDGDLVHRACLEAQLRHSLAPRLV